MMGLESVRDLCNMDYEFKAGKIFRKLDPLPIYEMNRDGNFWVTSHGLSKGYPMDPIFAFDHALGGDFNLYSIALEVQDERKGSNKILEQNEGGKGI